MSEVGSIPNAEQIAWATVVVGEMSGILHHEPRQSFWERIFGRPEADIIEDQNWKSYQVTMELAGWIARREG